MAPKPKVIAIVGPTSSGKTNLSITLAQHISGEVISADSRQVYLGLDIGTGKITPDQMNGIPHHLLDVADPDYIYTGAEFAHAAAVAIHDITTRGNLPIIAGGTFFYIDLLRGKMQAAPVEPDQVFRDTLEQYSNEELLELLQQKDPRRANTIEPQNRRRLVRALEIIHTLGSVPKPTTVESPYDWLMIGITIDKETLREKFAKRLTAWLEIGLLEEVARVRAAISPERFLELGFEYTLTADYIDKQITRDELFEQFVQKNWQYAKRQLTWLKRDPDIVWVDPTDIDTILGLTQSFLQQ